jgi:rhodanese-related sulfurtransferase
MKRPNFRYSFLACLIVIFAAAASLVGGEEGVTLISQDQLNEDIAKPDLIVVDVRTDHDWASSQFKIKGAQRQSPNEAKEWMDNYSKDKTIVLYCA